MNATFVARENMIFFLVFTGWLATLGFYAQKSLNFFLKRNNTNIGLESLWLIGILVIILTPVLGNIHSPTTTLEYVYAGVALIIGPLFGGVIGLLFLQIEKK